MSSSRPVADVDGPGPSRRGAASDARTRFVTRCAQLVLVNLAILVAYRLLFLAAFADRAARTETLAVLVRGVRLDAALLGIELLVLLTVSLLTRHLRYRSVLGGLWAFTGLNALGAAANLIFFRERNQHLWENLLANAAEPREVWRALEPFLLLHPAVPLATLFAVLGIGIVAARHGRPLARQRVDLWLDRRALGTTVLVVLLLVGATLEPTATKSEHWLGHVRIGATSSKHHMVFDDYVLNQAVANPVFDLADRLPGFFRAGRYHYLLDGAQAVRATESLLGLSPANPRYPLLRTVRGVGGRGIENVVLLQVEGLGTNLLERRTTDGYLTPYLHRLADEGLYFPDTYQSFSATDGSTFAIATSLPRTYGATTGVARFFPHEVNGHYGALSNVLAPRYRHYFVAGFRQRIVDFLGFMRNQGYQAIGFDELAARLGDRAERESNALGIFDGPMLEVAADVLVAAPAPFTAHIVTSTSHSPWDVPPGTTASFDGPPLAFRYVDGCVREFVERLRRELAGFDRTLFVIVGDHTSITFGGGHVERIRVPLILYGAPLAELTGRHDMRASHVDILPTILGLLDGEHPYAGMGRNLLAPDEGPRGVISSNYYSSLYVTDEFAVRSTPRTGATDLLAFRDGEIASHDVSAEHPKVHARLVAEYLALFETADRLTREKRVFPITGPRTSSGVGAEGEHAAR